MNQNRKRLGAFVLIAMLLGASAAIWAQAKPQFIFKTGATGTAGSFADALYFGLRMQ